MPVMELPRPGDESDDSHGTGLLKDQQAGTSSDMEAEDTQAYTVDDEFRISWLRDKLRTDNKFGGVRDSIHDGMLVDPAARYLTPYLNYLIYKEHGIVPDDENLLDQRISIETNFGKDVMYCTYKVVI